MIFFHAPLSKDNPSGIPSQWLEEEAWIEVAPGSRMDLFNIYIQNIMRGIAKERIARRELGMFRL